MMDIDSFYDGYDMHGSLNDVDNIHSSIGNDTYFITYKLDNGRYECFDGNLSRYVESVRRYNPDSVTDKDKVVLEFDLLVGILEERPEGLHKLYGDYVHVNRKGKNTGFRKGRDCIVFRNFGKFSKKEIMIISKYRGYDSYKKVMKCIRKIFRS